MLSAEEVRRDLDFICAQTNAHWLCYDDIHTVNFQKDTELYLKEMKRLGYTKELLLLTKGLEPAYAGGVEIKHQQEAFCSGYTLNGREKNNNRLVLLYGFDTDNDKHTVYHECAHLYQFKYNIFNILNREDYITYLAEVHANTFASMVLLLKADNVLEYKKRSLFRIADDISKLANERKEYIYYLSLPIELALMKEIRKKGRKNVLKEFSKNGQLDFKKIIFYTKKLVDQYGYSKDEFEKIRQGKFLLKYIRLRNKARVYHILGRAYWTREILLDRRKNRKHHRIEDERTKIKLEKMASLPEKDKESKILNDICRLDNYNVKMICTYDIWRSLQDVENESALTLPEDLKLNAKNAKDLMETFDVMCGIYQKWKDDKLFQQLFHAIQTLDGRDQVWAIKAKRQKDIEKQNFIFGLLNVRQIKRR